MANHPIFSPTFHGDVAKVLIDNGAGVTAGDGNLIHDAGQRRHRAVCRLLVEHGAVDDLPGTEDIDVRMLFRAAYSDNSDAINAIPSQRPERVHHEDKNGRTAFHEACTNGDTKSVCRLLTFNPDTSARDNNGQTPADRAAAHNQHAVIRLLNKHATPN